MRFCFTLHKLHHDTMSVEIDGLRHWEPAVIQRLHVSELFRRRDPRQVNPAHLLPLLVVVSLLSDLPETGPAQPVELEAESRLALGVPNHIDVGLLSGANLIAE